MSHEPRKSYSLRLLLSYQFGLVATLPLLVVCLLTFFLLLPKIETTHTLGQQALAKSMSGQVQAFLNNAASDLNILTSHVLQNNYGDRYRDDMLDIFTSNQGSFEAIYLANGDGIVIAAGLPSHKQYLRNNFIGLDMSHKPFYAETLTSRQPTWSDTFLSAVSGRLSVAYAQTFNDGMLIGEIAVEELPTLVTGLAEKYGMTVMILDQKGQLIAHPDPDLSHQQINLSHLQLVRDARNQRVQSQRFIFNNASFIGTAIVMERPEWLVIAAQAEAEALSEEYASLKILIAAIVLGMVLAALTALLLAREFSQGFRRTTKQAKSLAEGRYCEEAKPGRIKELNRLAGNLHTTALTIADREQELISRERRFRTLVEQSPLAIIEWDTRFQIRVSNHLANKLLHTGDVMQQLKAQIQNSGGHFTTYEITTRQNDQRLVLMSFNTTTRDRKGDAIGYLSVVQDITEQRLSAEKIQRLNENLEQRVKDRTHDLESSNRELKQALDYLERTQEELVQAEKMAALGSLVAGVSHELNTPIGNSLMASSTLAEHTLSLHQLAENGKMTRAEFENFLRETEEGHKILISNLQRASELISSFKQVAVDQSSDQQRHFKLQHFLHEILTTLQPMVKKTSITITLKENEEIEMFSYPGALAQIITNLIQNALLHAFAQQESGNITISACRASAEWVELRITDNGCGIPKDQQKIIFDPFYTTRMGQGGTGLGLNIVHNLVTGPLEGTINVESKPEEGTTMLIQIPVQLSPAND